MRLAAERTSLAAAARNRAALTVSERLAWAETLWVLRDLTSAPGSQSEQRLLDVAAQFDELAAAAHLLPATAAAVVLAARTALAAGDATRTSDLVTWDGAATGLDLCECAYVRRDRGAILGDIAGFYKAFGVAQSGLDRRPDQLASELEFLGLLLLLAVRAEHEGNAEATEITSEAADDFWRDHLGEWCALPAARAQILPAPAWLRATLEATALVCAGLADAMAWPAPAYDDAGEGDSRPDPDAGEVTCAMA